MQKIQWILHNCGNTTEATTLLQQIKKEKKNVEREGCHEGDNHTLGSTLLYTFSGKIVNFIFALVVLFLLFFFFFFFFFLGTLFKTEQQESVVQCF